MKPVAPFPWNPRGFVCPSVEHLFQLAKPHHSERKQPGTHAVPAAESHIALKKPTPGRTGQISKARI